MMTRDHNDCRSHGGAETVENMNPMCSRCNKLRGTKPLEPFLADYKAGKFNTANRSGTGKKPRHDVIEMVVLYVSKHGVDSHLTRLIMNHPSKLWKREEFRELCTDRNSEKLVEYLITCGANNRSKVAKYFREKYLDTPTGGYTGNDPRAAYGILQSLARNYLNHPSITTEASLRRHLEICKGIKL
jgi:hypothetical protein